MTNLEIKQKIDCNNELISQLVAPGVFILNKDILNLLEENRKLRAQCSHHFVDGFCEFCYESEEVE